MLSLNNRPIVLARITSLSLFSPLMPGSIELILLCPAISFQIRSKWGAFIPCLSIPAVPCADGNEPSISRKIESDNKTHREQKQRQLIQNKTTTITTEATATTTLRTLVSTMLLLIYEQLNKVLPVSFPPSSVTMRLHPPFPLSLLFLLVLLFFLYFPPVQLHPCPPPAWLACTLLPILSRHDFFLFVLKHKRSTPPSHLG